MTPYMVLFPTPPTLGISGGLKSRADPCYRDIPSGQGRGLAKGLNFFLGKTAVAGEGL